MHIKYSTSEFVLGPFEFSSFGTIIGYLTLVSDFFRLKLESVPGSVPGPPARRSCDSDIGRLVIRSVGLWIIKMRIKHFKRFHWMIMNDQTEWPWMTTWVCVGVWLTWELFREGWEADRWFSGFILPVCKFDRIYGRGPFSGLKDIIILVKDMVVFYSIILHWVDICTTLRVGLFNLYCIDSMPILYKL